MRILLTIHHHLDAAAGAPGVTLALRDAFRAAGHEASILSFDDMPSSLPARARELLFPEFVAAHLARAPGHHVVDASTGDAWIWARLRRPLGRRGVLICRLHGLEHVFWEQERLEAAASGTTPPLTTRLYHGGLRLREVEAALRGSDACFFLNAGERARAVATLRVRPDAAFVVRNGIPDALVGLPAPAVPAGAPRIAHLGSFTARKGIRYLVPALAAVLARRADAAVTYLGPGVPAGQVIADHPAAVRDRIRVVDSYDRGDLPALLAGHHLIASASLAEGFSLALPEAMACGLAPVVTALDGAREIVSDGHNGRLVAPRDAGALERALLDTLADGAALQRLRVAAHATAQELGWYRVAAAQLALYGELGRSATAIT